MINLLIIQFYLSKYFLMSPSNILSICPDWSLLFFYNAVIVAATSAIIVKVTRILSGSMTVGYNLIAVKAHFLLLFMLLYSLKEF